jgi:hypothetical protein
MLIKVNEDEGKNCRLALFVTPDCFYVVANRNTSNRQVVLSISNRSHLQGYEALGPSVHAKLSIELFLLLYYPVVLSSHFYFMNVLKLKLNRTTTNFSFIF